MWRAHLRSPGGELPFELDLTNLDEGIALIRNGSEEITAPIARDGDTLTLSFPVYDATIKATLSGSSLEGEWRKTTSKGESSLPFHAELGKKYRFRDEPALKRGDRSVKNLSGRWHTRFKDPSGDFAAIGEFSQSGSKVTGTFLTATGDFRYLAGEFRDGLLRLSTFDGAHAFLFHARAKSGELVGDFWSRDTSHATFVAQRAGANAALPNSMSQVSVVSPDRKLRFSFPDADGRLVSSADERFLGKVVVLDIFGTWCPNCNDAAQLLVRLHNQYRTEGLEVVGLAFEFTGEPKRDSEMLRRFKKRHKIEYPLLLAGVSDKAKAGAALPDLSAIKSFPTAVFIGRDGRVAKIHSGFSGPGTGAHYEKLVEEYETTVKELLRADSKEVK